MLLTTANRRGPFVRPRFTDGTFDAPLLLEDAFSELFLSGLEPRHLLLAGPRGSGLTTALAHLTDLARAAGRHVVNVRDALDLAPRKLLPLLREGDPILLLDLSVTPLPRPKLEGALAQLLEAVPTDEQRRLLFGSPLVIAGPSELLTEDWHSTWVGSPSPVVCTQLTPWSSDDLLELLGSCPNYQAAQAFVFPLLQGQTQLRALLGRPRTARWLVEAALALDPAQPAPEGPAAVCAVFANLLDRLSPWAIETLQALESGSLDGEAVETLLLGATTPDPVEACELFEVDGRLARQIATSRAGPIRGWRNLTDVRFALPRLPDFLQAGNCLQKIARSVVPRPISPSWFPYLCELITPAHRDELRGWLEAETPHGDSAAATILWATGETPNLEGPRKRNLSDAVLPGVPLAGVKLPRANLRRANLERAHLEGASLEEIFAPGLSASFANFSGANLSSANLRSADLRGARFSGVTAEGAVFDCATLTGACLEGAFLRNASFSDAFLEGADLTRADLTLASLRALVLSGTNFQWANLTQANLRRCDLRWADLSGANLSGAIFQGCALSAVELDELAISQSGFFASELSGTTFRDADLHEAYFTHCWAHEANFEGADLRNSIFEEVTFHAGSSRSGLLLGGPASEGTRTGYYEGTNDDAWSPPESVRQASFCGADLRGASFRSTDLFRVDFRDALLDPELRTQAEQAGAIL